MGDHFVLLVDRLLTESTLVAAIESRNQASNCPSSPTKFNLSEEKNDSIKKPTGNVVECRICQEEDDDSNMETPCSCCGSLRYAHRKCVQKWCNEKGGTTCEICLQQFKPGYTAPPKLVLYGRRIPMNFRGNWASQENHNLRYIETSGRNTIGSSTDDYSTSNARSIIYCRIVAIIFMVLLVLHDALPIILTESKLYSFTVLASALLRTAGIVLPIYIILRAILTFHHRQYQHQVTHESSIVESGSADSLP
ncbi:uncharacterized protein [Typha latifolia]|uniref:uncharacterized protein isoform X1 n=1 Tax=Typha latifolia TaxID=4733 RepID=UPI003C3099FD